jgi:hypothetical protein
MRTCRLADEYLRRGGEQFYYYELGSIPPAAAPASMPTEDHGSGGLLLPAK